MKIYKSKFNTKIGTLYYLWEGEDNVDIGILFIGNSKKKYLDYIRLLKNISVYRRIVFLTGKSNKIEDKIKEYLDGRIKKLNIGHKFLTGTEFEKKVWEKVISIPYGKTVSYKKLALLTGYHDAQRAVGSALRKNLLMLVVPCHRVIKSNGKPGKFSGGEIIKKFLLTMEKS